MKTFILEKIANMYDQLDSVMITNRDGIIEYSALFDQSREGVQNEGYTGKSILEVHPALTRETSTHFRVMDTGKPIIDEVQTLTDFKGKTYTLLSSTFPIESNGNIIGAIEGAVMLNEDGQRFRTETVTDALTQKQSHRLYTLDDIITCDKKMLEIKDLTERVAAGESFVMIQGETGTGKELIAQSIHSHSARSHGPFISQNCAAIPSELLESTLFGTAKGGFTGAVEKKGLFELADNGTLFLDELNSLDYTLQSKILKAIEEQKIRRVGDEKEIDINVRIVSATNMSPDEAIASGRLRADLFFRLAVVNINLPGLRERKDDIPLLTDYFIQQYDEIFDRKITGCDELVKQVLINYPWPGNVRELRNAIEYAFNTAKGTVITLADIPEKIIYDKGTSGGSTKTAQNWEQMLQDGTPLPQIVDTFEKDMISGVMNESKSLTDAADKLHITRQALNYKLEKYGLRNKSETGKERIGVI